MPSLINAFDVVGILKCLSFATQSTLIICAKRQLRDDLMEVWNTMDFFGVNESFAKWEACQAQRKRARAMEDILAASIEASRCGLSQEAILEQLQKVIDGVQAAATK